MQETIIIVLTYMVMFCSGMSIGMNYQHITDICNSKPHRSRNTHIILGCIIVACIVVEFVCLFTFCKGV